MPADQASAILFYAPMKPPDDPTPSGDREVARTLVAALECLGHQATLASRLRAWQRRPDHAALEELKAQAAAECDRIVSDITRRRRSPKAFVTYHLYHRAPDLIGPEIAERLSIPYLVIEASRALKRSRDDWREHFHLADQALQRADAVIALQGDDLDGLTGVIEAARLHHIPPFLDLSGFAPARTPDDRPDGPCQLLTVGMMRAGDKAASYQLLAEALSRLDSMRWRLTIAGDGPARAKIEPLFPKDRTTFLGRVPRARLADVYRQADLFVWPAIREAFGLVFLEAQASGLPVIGARRGGVPNVVADGETGLLVPEGDVEAFSEAVTTLIRDPERRQRMGVAARARVLAEHDLAIGVARLGAILDATIARHGETAR
ncbi:MAG: glycosyltransferase family 4 protein [Pseudomonadota bacterium]